MGRPLSTRHWAPALTSERRHKRTPENSPGGLSQRTQLAGRQGTPTPRSVPSARLPALGADRARSKANSGWAQPRERGRRLNENVGGSLGRGWALCPHLSIRGVPLLVVIITTAAGVSATVSSVGWEVVGGCGFLPAPTPGLRVTRSQWPARKARASAGPPAPALLHRPERGLPGASWNLECAGISY